MRVFVSYARVDKHYCIQIVNMLDVHDVWYDQRLRAGNKWWTEILRRLEWCEGFVYLLSPDSVDSEYCRREFELARSLGKHIFPVLIHEQTTVPDSINDMQYVDLSKGLTPENVRILLNSIYIAERQRQHQPALPVSAISSDEVKGPSVNPSTVISIAATAMEKGQYDQAVFLLKQAKASGYTSRFINIETLLAEAETSLERQAYLREADREYRQIAELIKYKKTRKLGCEAYQAFQKDFPDYDPDCLAQACEEAPVVQVVSAASAPALAASVSVSLPAPEQAPVTNFSLPLLEWVDIPGGIITVDGPRVNGRRDKKPFYVDAFRISKYPITNAQYQVFLDDPMGYANLGWWQYSMHAHSWRVNNAEPKPSRFSGDERPRETVNWFDAMAFTYWLTARLGVTVSLPTREQWQRAAQGDDTRLYPWGDDFNTEKCNTRESELKMTTLVMRYPEGVSPFGVFDMAGNVWEWCLNIKTESENALEITSNEERAVCGGSFVSAQQRAQVTFHYYLNPQTYYASIGFRVVQSLNG